MSIFVTGVLLRWREAQTQDSLALLSTHKSSAVRVAAVLALRKQKSANVEVFLQDEDLAVATEAVRAIHDVPMHDAMENLALSLPRCNRSTLATKSDQCVQAPFKQRLARCVVCIKPKQL